MRFWIALTLFVAPIVSFQILLALGVFTLERHGDVFGGGCVCIVGDDRLFLGHLASAAIGFLMLLPFIARHIRFVHPFLNLIRTGSFKHDWRDWRDRRVQAARNVHESSQTCFSARPPSK